MGLHEQCVFFYEKGKCNRKRRNGRIITAGIVGRWDENEINAAPYDLRRTGQRLLPSGKLNWL